jgi:hypothetical protein
MKKQKKNSSHRKRSISLASILITAIIMVTAYLIINSDSIFSSSSVEYFTEQRLSEEETQTLASLFDDNPFQGGQVAPMNAKWVNDNVFVFLQFDESMVNRLQYIGLGVKGVFCAETIPSSEFTNFQKWSVPSYTEGVGGQRGDIGYWLMRVAVDDFRSHGVRVVPGIEYRFSPTQPQPCGNVPSIDMAVASKKLSQRDIEILVPLFNDSIISNPTVISKWMNSKVFIFLQFSDEKMETLRYIGIGEAGRYCKADRPSKDFSYSQGYWMMIIASDSFDLQNKQIVPGIIPAEQSVPEC